MGKFGAENFDQSNMWRYNCKFILEHFDSKYNVIVTNPNDYYNFKDTIPSYESQQEIMLFDLYKVRQSDLLLVNFNDMYSLGSMAEIAIAYEHRIPIIGLDEMGQELHPWQIAMTNRIFNNIDKMIEHVEMFYLS